MTTPYFPAVEAKSFCNLYGSAFILRREGRYELIRPEDFSVILFDHDEEESEKETLALSILRKIIDSAYDGSYVAISHGRFVFDGSLGGSDLTVEEYMLLERINEQIDLERTPSADPQA